MDLPSHCVIGSRLCRTNAGDGSVEVHAMVAGSGTAECMFDQCTGTLKVTGVLIATSNISVLTTVLSVFFPILSPYACFFHCCSFTNFLFKANIHSSLKYSKPCSSFSTKEKSSRCNVKQLFELGFILLVCLCQVLGVGFRVHSSCMSICQSGHK